MSTSILLQELEFPQRAEVAGGLLHLPRSAEQLWLVPCWSTAQPPARLHRPLPGGPVYQPARRVTRVNCNGHQWCQSKVLNSQPAV